MALEILTTSLTTLLEGVGAIGTAASGFISTALPAAGIAATITIDILQIINSIEEQEIQRRRVNEYLSIVNNSINNITDFINQTEPINLNQDQLELATKFFPKQMETIIKNAASFNTIREIYLNGLSQLNNFIINGELLVVRGGNVVAIKDYPANLEQNKRNLQEILRILNDLGIIDSTRIITREIAALGGQEVSWVRDLTALEIEIILENLIQIYEIIKTSNELLNYYYNSSITIINEITSAKSAVVALPIPEVVDEEEQTTTTTLFPRGTYSRELEELEKLEKLLLSLGLISLSRTRTLEEKPRNKGKWKKFFPRKKLDETNAPREIKGMSLVVADVSNWIQKISFEFPSRRTRASNERGTMRFHLKKGGVIRKVRVKRGTFSVIAMWSLDTPFGTGYRYWSQFNKKAIVNRDKVFSWIIPLINNQDREIAIPLELTENRVKYY